MLPIGLDLGTGFVKCAWNRNQIKFPSLYAVKTLDEWDEPQFGGNNVIEAVGWKAMSMMRSQGATEIRPIVLGEPREEYEYHIRLLIQNAIYEIKKTISSDAVGLKDIEEICMVLGLPYKSTASKPLIKKILRKIPQIKKSTIVLQASGTYLACGRKSAVYVSIGQGTTEVMVCENHQRIFTDSFPIATEFISSKIGEYAYLDVDLLKRNMANLNATIDQFTMSISSKIGAIQQKIGISLPVIFSGGCIMIPGIREGFQKHLKRYSIEVPENAEYLNAQGNLMYAKKIASQK